MKKLLPFWLTAFAVAAACTTHSPQADHEVGELISIVANDARELGPNSAVPARPGPLFVDVNSFLAYRAEIESSPAVRRSASALLPPGTSPVRGWGAVRCKFFADKCVGREDGLYVRLDSLERNGSGTMDAFVTYRWSERLRSGPPGLGEAEIRLELRSEGSRWKLARKTVLGAT
jgi:hypothetical protein